MSGVDRALVERFVEIAADTLRGEWVVIGGTVLPLVGVEHRVTWDIDVAGPDDARLDQTLALMEIAERLGLPVEAINQAGAYFLHRLEGWRDELVAVRTGRSATILRPDATLFVRLKIGRMTESDLADCRAMIEASSRLGEPIRAARLRQEILAALGAEDSPEGRSSRLGSLLTALPT